MFKHKTIEEKKAFKEKVSAGVIGIGIGVAIGIGISKRDAVGNFNTMIGLVNINKSININYGHLIKRGHAGNVTRCIETGEIFASQGRAAEAYGINRSDMTKHLKGLKDKVKGKTFEIIEEFDTSQK